MGIETTMAVRNIWRNPRRSILTISALAFASLILIFMLSFQFGSYEAMIQFSVGVHTGDMQIQAKGYNEKKEIRMVVPDPEKVGKAISKNPLVSAYTFRANAFSLVSSKDRTYGVMVIGIDPEKEAEVSTLKGKILQGGWLENKDYGGAIIGVMLAENLKVGIGDKLTIIGQGRDGSIAATAVHIKGIYKSDQDDLDRSAIQINLENFQDSYSMRGAVSEVVVNTPKTGNVNRLKNELATTVAKMGDEQPLVVLDWDDLMPGLKQGIEMDLFSGLIFYLILIIVVAFSILNTFLMAVLERTREFGVLMAMGLRQGRLFRLLLLESTTMMILGVGVGMLLGVALTLYFQINGIPMGQMGSFGLPDRIFPQLSLPSLLIGPVAILFITFLTSLYPALKVLRLKPVEAMYYA